MCKFRVYIGHVFVYCNMITTAVLAKSSVMSHNYHIVFGVWEQLRSSLSATLKLIIVYTRNALFVILLIFLINKINRSCWSSGWLTGFKFGPLNNIVQSLSLKPWKPPFKSLFLWIPFYNSSCKGCHTVWYLILLNAHIFSKL